MRKKQSGILDAVHATARGLHAAEAIGHVTMREFDLLWPKLVLPLRPAEIKRIRESANVSQAVFTAILNTSKSSVQKWEVGQKRPTGTALKLLHLVQRNGIEAVS